MPHSKSGIEIKVGSVIKGPSCSQIPGHEMIGPVTQMRTGQKCSGDITPLLHIFTGADGSRTIIGPDLMPHANGAFDADQVEVIA